MMRLLWKLYSKNLLELWKKLAILFQPGGYITILEFYIVKLKNLIEQFLLTLKQSG